MFASTWFAVNQRQLVNPPATLWRVEHSGNQDNVFSSRESPVFTGWSDFSDAKRAHTDWHSRRATPFLSTFSNYRHAANWAQHRVDEMGDRCVQIHEIDTDGLLVCGAGGDEYLVIDEIPDANVVDTIDLRPPPPRRRRGRRRGGRGRKSQNTNYYDSTDSTDDW